MWCAQDSFQTEDQDGKMLFLQFLKKLAQQFPNVRTLKSFSLKLLSCLLPCQLTYVLPCVVCRWDLLSYSYISLSLPHPSLALRSDLCSSSSLSEHPQDCHRISAFSFIGKGLRAGQGWGFDVCAWYKAGSALPEHSPCGWWSLICVCSAWPPARPQTSQDTVLLRQWHQVMAVVRPCMPTV